jgi:hypothetical protein
MPTIREICPVISASFGIPNVERWAAAMAADGQHVLDGPANAEDVATLVLAVLGAPVPEQATEAWQSIVCSEISEFRHAEIHITQELGRTTLLSWPDLADWPAMIDASPSGLIVEMLQAEQGGVAHGFTRIMVGEMGAWVGFKLDGMAAQGQRWEIWLKFASDLAPTFGGAVRSTGIATNLLRPVAEAMRDESHEQPGRKVLTRMPSAALM